MLLFVVLCFACLLFLQMGIVYIVGTSYTVSCNYVKSCFILYIWFFYASDLVQTATQIALDVPVTADKVNIRIVAVIYGCLDCTATILNTKALYLSTVLHHLFVIGTSVGFCMMLFDFPCANIVAWYLIWSLAAFIPNMTVARVKFAQQHKCPMPHTTIVAAVVNYAISLTCNWIGCVVLFWRAFASETPLRLAVGSVIVAGWVADDALFVNTLRRWYNKSLLLKKCH